MALIYTNIGKWTLSKHMKINARIKSCLFIAHGSIAHVFTYSPAKQQAFLALWCQLQNTILVKTTHAIQFLLN